MIQYSAVAAQDPQVAKVLDDELNRQQTQIELIASENFVSEAVMQAAGCHLTNKYAEGYPGRRYYGGCENVDVVEELAIERAKQIFGCSYANVQPHSGSQANCAVFFSQLKPGDTFLGMSLDNGGHLTHGSPVNFSGKIYNAASYGVDEKTGLIDYDNVRDMAKKTQAKMIIAGFSAYPRALDFQKFREIADETGAVLMVDMAHIAGLIAAGEHQSPIPYADFTTTTTHKTLRGPRGGMVLTNTEENAKAINKAVFPGLQGGPLMHIISAKAVGFGEALQPSYKEYIHQVVLNAKALAKGLTDRGINLVTGGTDNHLMLIDLRGTGMKGNQLEHLLHEANITTNKNAVPNDPEKPSVTSGVRIGTPAMTTRGLKEAEMDVIADCIATIVHEAESGIEKVKGKVAELCEAYPLYR